MSTTSPEKKGTATKSATTSYRKNFIFTIGAKGGVGKSFWSSLLLDWLKENGVPVTPFDCDASTQTLRSLWPAAELVKIEDVREVTTMFQRMIECDSPVVLADLKAGSAEVMIPHFQTALEGCADVLEEQGIRVTACSLIPNEPDAIFSMAQWVKALGSEISWLVVANEVRGGAVTALESDQAKIVLKSCNARTFVLPQMQDIDAAALRNNGLSIRGFLDRTAAGEKIPFLSDFLTTARIKAYRKKVFTALDQIQDAIVP